MKWLKKSAEKGDPHAMYEYWRSNKQEEEYGVKAINSGNEYVIGMILFSGSRGKLELGCTTSSLASLILM